MARKKATKENKSRSAGAAEVKMGHRIRLRRVEQKMSQQELGEALGVSFQQVQKYEKGVNRVGAARIEQIAKVLKVPLTFFFGDGEGGNIGKEQSELETLLFMDSNFNLRMLRAAMAIKEETTRRRFILLMEAVAGTAAEE